jgi:hypothetical protein
MTTFATSPVHATYARDAVYAHACLSSAILAQLGQSGQLAPQLVSAIIEYNLHACVDGRQHPCIQPRCAF